MKKMLKLILVTILPALFVSILVAAEAKAQILPEILKRMNAHQKVLFTLSSKVNMERRNSQLGETEVSEGTMIYMRTNKNQILTRIDWINPVTESLSFVNNQYLLYRPRLKQAIIGKLDRIKTIEKMSGALSFLYMSRKELAENFTILYLGTDKAKSGTETWHLRFTPRNASVYKSAEFWVDGSGMPVQAKVIDENKDSTTVLLSDFKKNTAINNSAFAVSLPKGTKIIKNYDNAVKTSTGDCSCFKPTADETLKYWSDVVFSGKVIATKGADYIFKTERMWKGRVADEMVVRILSIENHCAVKLATGESYIVFARKVNVEGETILGLLPCSLTDNILSDSGKKILEEIGNGKPVKKIKIQKKRRIVRNFQKRRS